jgi:hypothetical protein
MQIIGRIFILFGAAVAIGVALWLSITLFGLMLLVGGGVVLFFAVRQFLIDKGILNPTPGVAPHVPEESITVIEGTFEEVENPMVRDESKKQ